MYSSSYTPPSVGYSNPTSYVATNPTSYVTPNPTTYVAPNPTYITDTVRKYPSEYTGTFNDSARYHSTGNAYTTDYDIYRPVNVNQKSYGSLRAYSSDDLYRDYNRSQYSTYETRPNPCVCNQQQPIRHAYQMNITDDLVVKSTDLSASYEQQMIELVRTAFSNHQTNDQRDIAGFLKRAADQRFSTCWHCVVGKQFSSYVTHEMQGFIYFTKGPLSILLFKSGP
jgi:dynein light chain LC8-type